MEKFRQWAENKHEYARQWKEKTGGKVLGYFCTYVPEEILYAADILPVRIFGGHESEISIAETHISTMYCCFCRDCLAQGLKGQYKYLDGITIAQSCLHMRQAYWSWRKHIPLEFSHYIYMPHRVRAKGADKYLRWELEKYKSEVEGWIGRKLTDSDLERGIEICNTNRRLLREVWEYRREAEVPLTGLEAMEIVISSQVADKRDHNEALRELLGELPERSLSRETGTRLMLIGSEMDDRKFVNMVEHDIVMPATFVIEDHCVGSRYFWNEVILGDDPLMSIANRYIDRPPCPSKDWPEYDRFNYIFNLYEEWGAEGVIMTQQKFCDPQELDYGPITEELKKREIPFLNLETDVTVPVGQFRVRVEAFLEITSGII